METGNNNKHTTEKSKSDNHDWQQLKTSKNHILSKTSKAKQISFKYIQV